MRLRRIKALCRRGRTTVFAAAARVLTLGGRCIACARALAVPQAWSPYNTGEYIGTIAFAYICFIMFILFSFALVVFQSAVSEELGIGE